MPAETLRVSGYREFLRACAKADKDSRKEVRAAFREVGEVVRVEAASLFESISPKSAAGYRVRVRQRGISVEQSLRKTDHPRPGYGALQMRKALLPALAHSSGEVEQRFEAALDRVADHFEKA